MTLTWAPPRLFAAVEPFTPLPAALYESGVSCLTLPIRRENPHAKDTRFLETAAAAYGSLPPGRHEGLLVAEDGAVLEGLSSNFFAVREGSPPYGGGSRAGRGDAHAGAGGRPQPAAYRTQRGARRSAR